MPAAGDPVVGWRELSREPPPITERPKKLGIPQSGPAWSEFELSLRWGAGDKGCEDGEPAPKGQPANRLCVSLGRLGSAHPGPAQGPWGLPMMFRSPGLHRSIEGYGGLRRAELWLDSPPRVRRRANKWCRSAIAAILLLSGSIVGCRGGDTRSSERCASHEGLLQSIASVEVAHGDVTASEAQTYLRHAVNRIEEDRAKRRDAEAMRHALAEADEAILMDRLFSGDSLSVQYVWFLGGPGGVVVYDNLHGDPETGSFSEALWSDLRLAMTALSKRPLKTVVDYRQVHASVSFVQICLSGVEASFAYGGPMRPPPNFEALNRTKIDERAAAGVDVIERLLADAQNADRRSGPK